MMKQLPARWNALVVLLALATMVGCQGLSSSNKSSTTNTTNNTKPGLLTVSPTSISFGIVKVGNNQNQPATMTNSGGSSLTVTKVTPTGTGFTVERIEFAGNPDCGPEPDFHGHLHSTGTWRGQRESGHREYWVNSDR